jgi:hypothetical protein
LKHSRLLSSLSKPNLWNLRIVLAYFSIVISNIWQGARGGSMS